MSSKELSRIDNKLLELADKGASGVDMEAATGVPAAEAMIRVRQILQERDWLTELERQKMNIMGLQEVKATLLKSVNATAGLDVETVQAFIRATQVMDSLLDKSTRITDDQLNTISNRQAKALVTLMTYAWDKAIGMLEERYPDIDVLEITDTFNDGLREGVNEL